MEIRTPDELLLDTLLQNPGRAFWWEKTTITEASIFLHDAQIWGQVAQAAGDQHIRFREWEVAVRDASKRRNGFTHSATLPAHETLTELLAADIPPPVTLFAGLLHEGMLLFAGKSKRGKSWLIFDLAISLAVGRAAFGHFACPVPRPVLYLALEDGRARLQGRVKQIQPNLTRADNFHLRYQFPPLADGGIEALGELMDRYHYGLIIIDVLAKLEKVGTSTGQKSYLEVYEMFSPLQEMMKQQHLCLCMLTHLRKMEAEDSFDNIMGSTGYGGVQDVLWVMERKPKDDLAFLNIRDKDADEKTVAVKFHDGHWEYVGEGDEYTVARDQRKILEVLAQENREMGIEEIRKACSWPDTQYGYTRKLLITMVKEDMIHHSSYGKYSATVRARLEMGLDKEIDDHGNRVPF
jgi:AAA domain-containing protein